MRATYAAQALGLCLISALAAGCAVARPAVGPMPAVAGPEAVVPEEPITASRADGAASAQPASAEPIAGRPVADAGGDTAADPKPPLPAGAAPPATVAGRAFGEWLALYNRGTEREVEEFIGARFAPDFLAQLPVSALVAFHLQSREATGDLVAVEVKPAGEHSLDALAGGTSGGAMTISLAVEPEPPHRITRLRLVPPGS